MIYFALMGQSYVIDYKLGKVFGKLVSYKLMQGIISYKNIGMYLTKTYYDDIRDIKCTGM